MPVRRQGFRGAANQGLDQLSQLLAMLTGNMATERRQANILEQQGEQARQRDELNFQRQTSLAGIDPNMSPQEIAAEMQRRQQAAIEEARAKAMQERADDTASLDLDEARNRANMGDPFAQRSFRERSQLARNVGVDDEGFTVTEAQSVRPRPLSAAEQAGRTAAAQEAGRIDTQFSRGVSEFSPFSNIPGGQEFVDLVTDLQQNILTSDSAGEFRNAMGSALETQNLIDQVNELESRDQTQGVNQIDNRIATLVARSLESGRLTEGDIERVVGAGRAAIDSVFASIDRAIMGRGLLPKERAVLQEVVSNGAMRRALPILQAEVDLRLSAFQGLEPEAFERLRRSFDVQAMAESMLGGRSGGSQGQAPTFEEELARRRGGR